MKNKIVDAIINAILIAAMFYLGTMYSEGKAIDRAEELLNENRLQYNSNDITYVAIGKKQIKK